MKSFVMVEQRERESENGFRRVREDTRERSLHSKPTRKLSTSRENEHKCRLATTPQSDVVSPTVDLLLAKALMRPCSTAPRQFASVFANFTSQSGNASCLEKIENGSLEPLARKIRKNKGLKQTDTVSSR